MKKKELLKRYALFVVSLFVMGFGVALTRHGELGVSPVSSVGNVLALRYTQLSFGTWLIITNMLFFFGQIALLRRRFPRMQWLQVPLTFMFGYFTDFGAWLSSMIPNDHYVMKIVIVFVGAAIVGLSVALGVIANVIMNSGEAFIKTLADISGKNFGNVKIMFDCSWVLLSVLLSLVFFDGQVVGTREGTIIAAIFVGTSVKWFQPRLRGPLEAWLTK